MNAKREDAMFVFVILLLLGGIAICAWFIGSCASRFDTSTQCNAAFAFLDWAFGQ